MTPAWTAPRWPCRLVGGALDGSVRTEGLDIRRVMIDDGVEQHYYRRTGAKLFTFEVSRRPCRGSAWRGTCGRQCAPGHIYCSKHGGADEENA